jgi:hypothetical protein
MKSRHGRLQVPTAADRTLGGNFLWRIGLGDMRLRRNITLRWRPMRKFAV